MAFIGTMPRKKETLPDETLEAAVSEPVWPSLVYTIFSPLHGRVL